MKKYNLHNILRFSTFLNQFEMVERVVHAADGTRLENDVEYSYMLAMLADYIIVSERLDLDRSMVMRYAMIHDLVEAYAGDTYVFSKDAALLESKEYREHEALVRIKKEFPEYTDLTGQIETYEKREDAESKFVYVLDKIQPAIQIYLGGGKTWKAENMTYTDLMKLKDEKVKVYPELEILWREFAEMLEKGKAELFPR